MFLIIDPFYLTDAEALDGLSGQFETLEEAQKAITEYTPRYFSSYTVKEGHTLVIVELKDIMVKKVDNEVTWNTNSISLEEFKKIPVGHSVEISAPSEENSDE